MLALTGSCLLLPTRNSTTDAWYYAACVRHGFELFQPHHLLYNAVGWMWLRLLPGTPDALAALKVLNALAFGGCLLVLRDLLRRVAGTAVPVAGWLLVAGSSFAMLRFATENETYILPLLCSLLASRSWWRACAEPQRPSSWLMAGAWAAVAALLHQIHAGWWIGLMVGALLSGLKGMQGRMQAIVLFMLPALAIPLAYAAVLPAWGLPLTLPAWWHFVFRDLYAGHAGAAPSGHTLLLTAINLIRTFGQLHGTTFALVQRFPAMLGVVLVCLGLAGLAARRLWQKPTVAPRHAALEPASLFFRVHLLILLLQLGCAVWAEGNAEFMVMMPVLAALLLVQRIWSGRALTYLGTALLLWNLTFGLLPAHLLRTGHTELLLARLTREPQAWWLLSDPNLALNQLQYATGQREVRANVLPAPALLVKRPGYSVPKFREWLAERRAAGQPVYTDALGGPKLLDRARITQGGDEAQLPLLAGYHLARVDSFPTSFGTVYLTQIK